MKNVMNREELTTKITEYFIDQAENKSKDYHSSFKVSVSWSEENKCIIHLSQQYEGIGSLCDFARLSWLSELLGTEKIDLENQYYQSGCETCDWGSVDEVDIICYECKVKHV